MKKTVLLLVCLGMSTLTFAQSPDLKLVRKTVSYYLDGGTNNDFETLKKAFHKNAIMKFIARDGYKEVNAIEFFKGVMKPGPKQNRKTRIVSVDIMGTAAQAKLEIDYETFTFIDYMNLLKIDGEWKVVSKIFYRKNKAEK